MDSTQKSKFAKQKSSDSDGEEDNELEDMITELKSIPKGSGFSIPKPETKIKLRNYEPVDWNTFFPETCLIDDKIPIYFNGSTGPNIVCLHGAGHSALSFAPLAGLNTKHRIISFDFRGHGYNSMSEGEDLSQETLILDTIRVLEYVDEKFPEENIIIVGHSMGGSIATKACAEIFKNEDSHQSLFQKIQGLVVIDVVEGTAMEALPFMESYVSSRPSSFPTVEAAIEYMFKSGTIKNLDSAKVSVPPLVKEITKKGKKQYAWKTNLMSSQKYWTEWFFGLTKCFLSIKVPKVLLLAGTERMDTELTIANMQGKFKLSVLSNVGHIIHEDDPKNTLAMIEQFIHIFRIPANLADVKPIIGKLGTNNPKVVKFDDTGL